jgi:hypothetical protein
MLTEAVHAQVERITDASAEQAIASLRARQTENMRRAQETSTAHKCTSRCADGKCNKWDWENNCPVVCRLR